MHLTEASRELARAVHRDVAAQLDLVLADVAAWVAHDSPSGDVPLVDALARDLAARLDAYGLAVELVDGPPGLHVHAVLHGGGTARVALLCHHDTVYPVGTVAARPLQHDGPILRGPGVADMKGGVAVAAHVARLLAHLPHAERPFARLELVSTPDEESRASPFQTSDRLAGFDAVLVLECGRADGSVVSSRKGGAWPRILATGRDAHAGVAPDEGRNAVVALCHEALRIAALDGARPGLTAHVTRLVGGTVINQIPGSAELSLDVRASRQDDLAWALAEISRLGAHDGVALRLVDLEATPTMERTPAVAALAACAIALGAEVGHAFGEAATGGAADAVWLAAHTPVLDGLGPVGGHDHSPEEYVLVDTFAPRAGVIAGLIAAVDAAATRPR